MLRWRDLPGNTDLQEVAIDSAYEEEAFFDKDISNQFPNENFSLTLFLRQTSAVRGRSRQHVALAAARGLGRHRVLNCSAAV